MAEKKPLVNYGGKIKELQSGDTLPGSGGSGSVTLISGTSILNFGNEEDYVILTINNGSITNIGIKSFTFIPQETTETSIDDFSINNVNFTIENIIDNTSFDIRGVANNNASGNYTIKYLIIQ